MKGTFTNISQTTLIDLDSESEWLLSCLTPNQEVATDDFTQLDLTNVLHALECHRLTSLFYMAVRHKNFLTLSAKNLLEGRFAKKKLRMLTLVSELCKVVKRFEEANIPVVALKGPLLSLQYYNDYTLRECNDLDILVQPSDVQAAYEVLMDMGYEMTEVLWNSPKQKTVYHKIFHHYNMYNAGNHVMIELHWRLYSSNLVDKGATENLWNNLTAQKLGGLQIRALSRYDTFIYLCVHGSAHQWKRLFWVQDIVRIINKEGGKFVENAYHSAVERGVARHLLEGCHLAALLFHVDLPMSIQQAIQKDKRIEQLSAISMFAMNDVTSHHRSPLASWKSFVNVGKKVVNHYRTIYYLGGIEALLSSLKRFFINPKYWRLYSFSDRFFIVNYFAAPFLWAYSVVNKTEE